ncbi:BNR repeat-containing protein [Haloferula rosea]|uniref:BNR repeat-containing protein n=1 Tax=Haloferula rosea TaxID=490093 RepID=A0A934RCM0_9BACT|nr:BNR repeat-containing protein [Haloferula rosea]MBK1826571.1 BNR repeat-containing protein [Haloferula rosea]
MTNTPQKQILTAGRTTRPRSPRLTLPILLGALVLSCFTPLKAGELELIHTSIVDAKALSFASGPATRFGNVVNGRTHQQSPLVTSRGYQYATWFDAVRRLCIARRKLPTGKWETIRFNDHHFKSNDSHNTAVLGICEIDGTIHMAFDHHSSRLNYRISKPGVAHHPESVRWDASAFSGVLHTLGSVTPDKKCTYPRFFNAPNGNLMLYYRAVTSGNGHGMIEEYNGDRQDWTPGLGQFIARDLGTFSAAGESSKYRCPYMNTLSYAGDRLHATWIWRDRFDRTHPKNQHDLCYAYSDDHGRTWHNSDGKVIGRTGKSSIHLNSPGLVVSPIPTQMDLSNQNAQYAYPDGSVHVVHLQRNDSTRKRSYHHHWRTKDGVWRSQALPFSGGRPKLVGTRDQTLLLIYSGQGDRVAMAQGRANSDRTAWTWSNIRMPSNASCAGDPLPDLTRWEAEEVLSIYSQEKPQKLIRTQKSEPVDGMPSALKVLDYRLKAPSQLAR